MDVDSGVLHAESSPTSATQQKGQSMYELYIANKNYSSWSLRPWVLMRERGAG